MHGHEKIIAARMAGKSPKFVFLNDYPCKTDWHEHGDHATVCVHKEFVKSLDLRFLVGLAVSVSASTESRAKDLLNACKQAGAVRVASCHVQNGVHPTNQSGWTEIYNKEKHG